MRILVSTCNRAIVGGVERYLNALIPALLRRGHQVGLLYQWPSKAGEPTVDSPEANIPFWFWDDVQRGQGPGPAEWKPDVVYSHSSQSLPMESSLLDHYPTVLYAHVYIGTCTTGRKSHAFPQTRPCTRRFGPMCLVFHYPRRCGGLNPLRAWQMYRFEACRNVRLAAYRAILVASAHMYREFEQHGLDQEKLRLVPLPIVDAMSDAPPRGSGAPAGRILFVGRLTDLKGLRYLIEAIPRAVMKLGQQLTLTVVGDGPERRRLQELAQRMEVPATFTGWMDFEKSRDIMRECDLLAVPSLWPEPFGMVGMEAGSIGIPAVGYAVGGIPDWLIAGQTGELAPGDPPTVQGLAEAIVRALADPRHYRELCSGARALSEAFSMERHLAALEPILEGAAAAPIRVQETLVNLTT